MGERGRNLKERNIGKAKSMNEGGNKKAYKKIEFIMKNLKPEIKCL